MTAATKLIIDWITSLGWDTRQELGWPLFPGPEILNSPDQSVWITGTGGPGYITEEPSADASLFQARTRGNADDPFGPEEQAQLLDAMILGAQFPASVDGATIVHVHRLGGGPSPLPVDPGDLRHEFTCNYIIVTGV